MGLINKETAKRNSAKWNNYSAEGIKQFLDSLPEVEAVPVAYIKKMIQDCDEAGDYFAVDTLQWFLNEWAASEGKQPYFIETEDIDSITLEDEDE